MKKAAIVFVHGIVETTLQFVDIVDALNDYTCYNYALPGHDGSPKNFGVHTKKDWLNYVTDLILFAKSKADKVYVVGHSMGGLLLLDFLAKHKGVVDKAVFLALPLRIRPKIKGMIDSVRIAFKIGSNPYLEKKKRYYSLSLSRNIFNYWRFIFRYIDLFVLSFQGRKNFKKLDIANLLINSKQDEMVSYKIYKFFNDKTKFILLNKSEHTLYDKEERKELILQIKDFLAMP